MTEYIKREDAYTTLTDCYHHSTETQHMTLKEALDRVPAADVVEVVRCKDCKYCLQTDEFEYWCDGFCSPARLVRKEDFCSHGEYLNA